MAPNKKQDTSAEAVAAEYSRHRPRYEQWTAKLHALLEELLQNAGVDVHLIDGRTKTVESFRAKIQREGKQYSDPLQQITDLSGVRIILHYTDLVETVDEIIERNFLVDDKNSGNKAALLAPDQFGYLSLHKVIRLTSERSALPEWNPFAALPAEIQVRTVVQHAWATVSHALDYKNEAAVPKEFKRRLMRVAGLLEIADQEFLKLKEDQAALRRILSSQVPKGNYAFSTSRDSLREFLSVARPAHAMIEAAQSAGLDPDEEHDSDDDQGLEQAAAACALLKIDDLVGLELLLGAALAKGKGRRFYEQFVNASPIPLEDIGVSDAHLLAMLLIGFSHNGLWPHRVSKALGWYKEYAARVLAAGAATWDEKETEMRKLGWD